MVITFKHELKQILNKSKCHHISSEFEFLNSQINDAAFMLQWTLEHVSSSSINTVYIETDALANNHAIEGLQTFGELLCDTMRLEKTPTAYLFMCIYALWAYTHMKIHWPILLLCLSDVMIDQWREMRERFLKLTIVLAYGDKSEGLIASKLNWINVSTFKGTLQNFTEWSSAISYMWDITDPQAFKVVLLTSYDMWTTHTVKMRKKTQLISEGSKEIQIPYSDWSEMVALIVMNKGHHLRNLKIRAHVSVWDLNCNHQWFLTVTSSINTLLIS